MSSLPALQLLNVCSLLNAGLLLASIRDPDPVVFFEAKMLYRTVSEEVPTGEYTIPLGKARIARAGSDITLVGWGQQVAVLERAVSLSAEQQAVILIGGAATPSALVQCLTCKHLTSLLYARQCL
jgi:pyruvate/2-oxoglutarate/acetoin dehydrogenase E1 component